MSGKGWVYDNLFRATPPAPLPVTDWLGRLGTGSVQELSGLEFLPLVFDGPAGAADLLAHQAIARGMLRVTERGGGVVNEVLVHNSADEPVLILEGETLLGCKQNRVIARSVIVPAGATLPVQVGCMERGRWTPTNRAFSSGVFRADPAQRRATIQEGIGAGGLDQGRLWRDVQSALATERIASATDDYHLYLCRFADESATAARQLLTVRNQVGVLVTGQGHLLGIELLGHPETWTHVAARTVPTYLLAGGRQRSGRRMAPGEWLDALRQAAWRERRAEGLGTRIETNGGPVTAAGLWHDGRIASLSAFAAA